MTNCQTTYRALHDVGLAAWFGGSLFGAAGLNATAVEVPDRRSGHRAAGVPSSATSPVTSTGSGPSTLVGAVDKELGQIAGDAAERLPVDVVSAERQLRLAQFAVPAMTGVALVLASQAGEQQLPSEQLRETARRVVGV